MYDISRSTIPPHSNPQAIGYLVGPIKNEISDSQHCEATDMLHFLFTFCNTSYKPDIILIKWSKFKTEYEYEDRSYLESYISDICCKPGRDEPPLSWHNILSTVEVKHGDSEGKAKARSVKLPYNGGFTNLQGDEVVGSSKLPLSAPQKIVVDEEYPTHRCVSIAPLFSSNSHQVQSGHALAPEVKVSHFRLQIGRSHPERGADNCTKPTEPFRRGPGAMEPQSLVGSASRERS